MVRVTVLAGVALHWPSCGPVEKVSQSVGVSDIDDDSRTRAVSDVATPILVAAITNSPVPLGPPVRAKPSLDGVSPTAIISATGVALNVSSRELTPTISAAAFAF